MRGSIPVIIILALLLSPSTLFADDAFQPQEYTRLILPFLQKYCTSCHQGDEAEAGLNLNRYAKVDEMLAARKTWQRVLRQVKAGAMPPDGEPRPDQETTKKVVIWLETALTHIDPKKAADPGRVTLRRLNRTEYDNTLRDLFGVSLHLAEAFPIDDLGYGFDNIGDVLSISPLRMEQYLNAAEKLTTLLRPPGPKPPFDDFIEGGHLRHQGVPPRNSSDRGRELVPGTEVYAVFELPLPGEYEIILQAWGVEKPEEKDRSNNDRWLEEQEIPIDPKAKPVVEAELLSDQRVLGYLPVKPGNATTAVKQTYTLRFTEQAGYHTIRVRHHFPRDLTPEQIKAHLQKPLLAPRLGLRQIRVRGPLTFGDATLTPAHAALLKAKPDALSTRQALQAIADRAWRRPATTAELDDLSQFLQNQQQRGRSFTEAFDLTVQAILVSPNFLFRLEGLPPADARGEFVPLGDYALASRLSYFLWSSLPDEELFTLAARKQLTDPAVLAAQVDRMLRDPKSEAFIEGFFGQWLGLRKVLDVQVDRKLFPEFGTELREDFRRETLLFVSSLIQDNAGALNLLNADYTFLNERLAKFYGLKDPIKGSEFRRVSLAKTPRRGVLTHGSILTLTSYPNRTSPTRRGNWVLETLLGDEPPPPPENVPELASTQAAQPNLPLRKQLELHRINPSCVACHQTIDAIGFGFENFDAIGRWRDQDKGYPIDSSGELPGGAKFANPRELIEILCQRDEDFIRHLAGRMLTYALGRGVEYYDRPALDQILERTRGNGYRFRDLIREVVLSRPFLWQRTSLEPQESKAP